MNSPSSETLSTEDAVQTIGGRNTRGDKSDSPGRRNEKSYARIVFNSRWGRRPVCARPLVALLPLPISPNCVQNPQPLTALSRASESLPTRNSVRW